MFSKKIFLFIIFIIINNIISQSYNDPYYNDNNDESSNNDNDSDDKTGILIALICWSVIVFITTFAYVYCCICRDRRGSFATRNYHPDYLGDRVYLIPINQNGQPNNIKQKAQNNNNVNSNQILNLNSSNLEVEINYLFQNIMKPEIYTEKFGKEEKSCSICSNKFKLNKSKIVLTLCHHFFHFYCLKKYLINYENNNCPLCKYDLIKNIKYNFEDLYYTKIIPLDEKENPINEI